jgi:H+/Cl- antiporter ClcA
MNEPNFIRRFNFWRAHSLKEKQFVYLLSIVIGLIAGLAAVALKTSVHYIESLLRDSKSVDTQNWLYLLLPLVGITITVLFIRYFVKDDISHGVSQILFSISKRSSKIKRHNTYSSIVACSFTGGFGGSVGMEAPILFTGAAIGSNIGQLFHLNYKTLTLLIGCGVAGALSAIFKAPITGMIFTFEVLMLDRFLCPAGRKDRILFHAERCFRFQGHSFLFVTWIVHRPGIIVLCEDAWLCGKTISQCDEPLQKAYYWWNSCRYYDLFFPSPLW